MASNLFENQKYKDWVKSSLSLHYMKEGMVLFADKQSEDFHKEIVDSLKPNHCCSNACSTDKIKQKREQGRMIWSIKCSNNTCSRWLEKVIDRHGEYTALHCPHIAWDNTDLQKWSTHPWEVAKIYQPYGCKEHESAKDTDSAAMLELMLKCTFFQKYLSKQVKHFSEVKAFRNTIMHNSTLEVEETDMTDHIDKMLKILTAVRDEAALSQEVRESAAEAITNIEELCSKPLNLSLNKSLEEIAHRERLLEIEKNIKECQKQMKQCGKDCEELATVQKSVTELFERTSKTEIFVKQYSELDFGTKLTALTNTMLDLQTKVSKQLEDLRAEIMAQKEQVGKQEIQLMFHVSRLDNHEKEIKHIKRAIDTEETPAKKMKAEQDRQEDLKSREEFRKKERDSKPTSRESLERKEKEKVLTLRSKRKVRGSEEYRIKERDSKRTSRESLERKEKEKALTLCSKRKARQSEEFREKQREFKQTCREFFESKEKEKAVTLCSKRKARQSEEFRKKERDSKQACRKSLESKEKEKALTLCSKRKARQSEEYRKKERDSKQTSKKSLETKKKERVSNFNSMKRARFVSEYKQLEVNKKRLKREDILFKQKKVENQRKSKRKSRKDPKLLEKERIAKQNWRSELKNKIYECTSNSQKKNIKRKIQSFCANEQNLAKRRKYGKDITSCIELFHRNISLGPVYVCSCCHQTWFRQSVSGTKSLNDEQKQKYLTEVRSIDNEEWICITCKRNISSGKVPKLSVVNGMTWPLKPKELELFPLEERLISLRIPFMQMRELPRGRQLSFKGNVVNVPVEIQPVVDALPRPIDENITVPVKLKKIMSFKSCVFTENVRPLRVLVALNWLITHSKVYQNANVDIDQEWIKTVTESNNELVQEYVCPSAKVNDGENNVVVEECSKQSEEMVEEKNGSDGDECTDENVGNLDTLLDHADLANGNTLNNFKNAPLV